jgi:predicted nucleic-acid-binding Zn-ribbon protein
VEAYRVKSGVCPKCGSGDIRVIAVHRSIGASIATGFFSEASVDHHVCVDCGYTETYVSDPAELQRIAAKWPRSSG